jgi:hypothetical protein
MGKSNEPTDGIPEDDSSFHYLGSFEIFDADKLLSDFRDHHIRCSAEFPSQTGAYNRISPRVTARVQIYVHVHFIKEATLAYKKLGIEPW